MDNSKDLMQPGANSVENDQELQSGVAASLGPAYKAENVAAGDGLDAGVVGNLGSDINALLGTEAKFNTAPASEFHNKLQEIVEKKNPGQDISKD